MEFRDPNSQNLSFHYNREERLADKRQKEKKAQKGRRLFGFNLGSPLAKTFLNFIFIMLVIVFIRLWLIPQILGNDENYSVKTREMAFKEAIMVEITLKTLSSAPNSYLIWLENAQGESELWQSTLAPDEEELIYLTLPASTDKTYTLWIQEGSLEPVATSRTLP